MLVERLAEVEGAMEKMYEIQNVPKEEFLQDRNRDQYAFRAFLQAALQALLDATNHIVARIPGFKPKGNPYNANVGKLGKAGVLSKDFVKTAEKMAGYRNRLVHFYHEVEPGELYDILQNHLDDITTFKKQLAQFIREHTDDEDFIIQER